MYRPQKVSKLVQESMDELHRRKQPYRGWKRDFTEFALISVLHSEFEGIDENDESVIPILKKLESRESFLSNKIYFMSGE